MKCKILCFFIAASLILFLPGCSDSHRIETAAIIETVSVSRQSGELCYTFYRLSSKEEPPGTVIAAADFREACSLAENKYIPHLSLSKLRLLMVDKSLDEKVLGRDIAFISTQTYFSPVAYVCLCDKAALKRVAEHREAQSLVEQQLLLCRSNNPQVRINYLSIFNAIARGDRNGVKLACVNSEKELKTDIMVLFQK